MVLFVEGEEEIGSPTLPALLAEHADRLRSDVIVIADSANAAVDVPSFTTSLRGLVDCTVEVRLLERPVHSGMFGGPVGDALTGLCRVLGTLHDDAGDVAVAGLHRGSSDAPDLDPAVFVRDVGLLRGGALIGTGTLPERLWHRPALTVLGIDAPAPRRRRTSCCRGPGPRSACGSPPATTRPGGAQALTEHLTAHAAWGAEVIVTPGAVRRAVRARGERRRLRPGPRGLRGGVRQRRGRERHRRLDPVHRRVRPHLPGATVLVTGVGDPASRWHGIDESLDLGDVGARRASPRPLLLARLAG